MTTTIGKTRLRRALALSMAAAALTTCSSGGAASPDTTEAPATTEAPPVTLGSTTDRDDHDHRGDDHDRPDDTPAHRLAPHRAARRRRARLARPAMVVKIDNHPDARPQAGLNQADIVYEEIVEGITRFFAIFQSTDAGPIGPIRSARTTDVNLLNQLNRPLFVWSGGNCNVVRAIGGANADEPGHAGQAPGFYRDRRRRRKAPSSTPSSTRARADLYTTAWPGRAPAPLLHVPAGRHARRPVPRHHGRRKIDTDVPASHAVAWDPAQGSCVRTEYGAPPRRCGGARDAPRTSWSSSCPTAQPGRPASSPEAVTVGEGDALVFTDGKVIARPLVPPRPRQPAAFTDADGNPILLTPGRTWIELRPGPARTQVCTPGTRLEALFPGIRLEPEGARRRRLRRMADQTSASPAAHRHLPA